MCVKGFEILITRQRSQIWDLLRLQKISKDLEIVRSRRFVLIVMVYTTTGDSGSGRLVLRVVRSSSGFRFHHRAYLLIRWVNSCITHKVPGSKGSQFRLAYQVAQEKRKRKKKPERRHHRLSLASRTNIRVLLLSRNHTQSLVLYTYT